MSDNQVMDFGLDWMVVIRKLLRYCVMGIMSAFVAFYLARGKLDFESVIVMGLSIASAYAVLDLYSPSSGIAARYGFGATVGSVLAGGLMI